MWRMTTTSKIHKNYLIWFKQFVSCFIFFFSLKITYFFLSTRKWWKKTRTETTIANHKVLLSSSRLSRQFKEKIYFKSSRSAKWTKENSFRSNFTFADTKDTTSVFHSDYYRRANAFNVALTTHIYDTIFNIFFFLFYFCLFFLIFLFILRCRWELMFVAHVFITEKHLHWLKCL